MNNSTIFKISSILLFIAFLMMSYFYIQEKKHSTELIVELESSNSEKTSVTSDLEKMLNQYDALKTNNDSLNSKLGAEQDKIKKLLNEIKNVKFSNKLALEQYKKETETLRSIMRSYIIQIDSLNTLNQTLVAENREVKDQYESVQQENTSLLKVTDSLSGKVAEAQQLLIGNLSITGLNKRDKETDKVERIEKFKTCILIRDNKLAVKGKHYVYVRISLPDKSVLYESAENLFNFKGEDIVYTAARDFNFDGSELNLCVYYKHLTPQLVAGLYHVDIFLDKERVSSASFELK